MEVDEEKPLAAQGQKRPPEDELTNEQRLTKRFHLLNIGNPNRLVIIVLVLMSYRKCAPALHPYANAFADPPATVECSLRLDELR